MCAVRQTMLAAAFAFVTGTFAFTPLALEAQTLAAPFTTGYALLAQGNLTAARADFEAELKLHPDVALAWRQLGYIDHSLNDHAAAVAAIDRYLALMPNDEAAKLDRAYELAAANDTAQARAAFVALQSSSDPDVAAKARRQVAAMTPAKPPNFESFGYAENESRFHDTFFGLDARYRLAAGPIEPYVALHFTDDAKSASVPATTILNDDAIVLAFGLRAEIAKNIDAFVEGGQVQSLLTGVSESDLRYGLQSSARYGSGGTHAQTQVDWSLARYSRYANAIGYATVAHDFSIGSKVVRGVAGSDLALDTERAFYNNYLDGFAGLQVRRGTVTLRVVGVAGDYLSRGINLPVQRSYTSVNAVLLFGYSK
jgi:tetratricopeptide (TPR) repeat protein